MEVRQEDLKKFKDPLPAQIRKIREESFSIFISNLPQQISKAELEAIFWRAGKILDVFIPKEKRNSNHRGFAFVRFATLREEEKAVELAEGRSWGGRKIQANLAQFCSNRSEKRVQEKPKGSWRDYPKPFFLSGETHRGGFPDLGSTLAAEGKKEKTAVSSSRMDSGRRHRKRSQGSTLGGQGAEKISL